MLPPRGIALEELERDLIRQALESTGGNKSRAARLLGLSRDTFRYPVEKFQLAEASPPGGAAGGVSAAAPRVSPPPPGPAAGR